MEPLRPGQCLLPLLIGDEEEQLARAERLGRVSRFHDDHGIVCLGTQPFPLQALRYPETDHLTSLLRQMRSLPPGDLPALRDAGLEAAVRSGRDFLKDRWAWKPQARLRA
jgi:hypothetical protein